jgi:hypothetical protein
MRCEGLRRTSMVMPPAVDRRRRRHQHGRVLPDARHFEPQRAADNGTAETILDSVEKSIAQMRTGSALAEPDLAIWHPELSYVAEERPRAHGHQTGCGACD